MQVYMETERLILRRFTETDLDNLVDLDSDPEVMRFLSGGPATPREVIERDIMPRVLRSYEDYPGFGVWAAIEKASGDFLGWISLRPHEDSPPGQAELGYRLRRVAWGLGYATEGSHALIHKGFAELDVQRVIASTYEYNLASRRVMERLGLSHVRSYRPSPEELATPGTYQGNSGEVWEGDEVEYALDKVDWERREVSVRG